MSYTKTTWINNSAPALNATNLNKIEAGIADAHTALAAKASDLTLTVTLDKNGVPLGCTTSTSFGGGAFSLLGGSSIYTVYIYSASTAKLASGCFSGCTNVTDIYTNLSSLTVESGAFPTGGSPTYHYQTDFEIINRIVQALAYLGTNKAGKSTTLSGYGITNAYTKTETDNLLSAKADSATTLAGYGITDAYTQTETDNLLVAKADTETVNTALAAKASVETGSGTLSPATTAYTGAAGTFTYAKTGNICTVAVNISAFVAGKSYVPMTGLPYKAQRFSSSAYASLLAQSSGSASVNVCVDSSWLRFTRTSDTFADGETLTVTVTYIVAS